MASDTNKEAWGIWDALKPMIDAEIERMTKGSVQRRKAKVTTAPDNSVIGVTEPFGQELMLPYVPIMGSAQVGDAVWIEYVYGMSNAYVSMFADPTV